MVELDRATKERFCVRLTNIHRCRTPERDKPRLYYFKNGSLFARAQCAQGALDHKRQVPQRINQLGPRPMRDTPSFFRMHRAIKRSQGQQGTKGCLGFGVVFKMHSGDANHKTSTERETMISRICSVRASMVGNYCGKGER